MMRIYGKSAAGKAAGTGVLVMLASSMLAFPVFAHGHGSGHHRVREPYCAEKEYGTNGNADGQCPVCTLEGCEETGRHQHDGGWYCGYHHDGGFCDGSCQPAGACMHGQC